MTSAYLKVNALLKSLAMRRMGPYFLLIAIALVYAAFLTRTYYWDGVLFSLQIEAVHQGKISPATLFHPNHLVYSALGYLLYSGAVACGLNLRAITLLQIFNVGVSAAAGFAIFALSKHITKSSYIALFSWLLFAFGATWWKFSTDADSYILSVLFLILTIMFAVDSPPRIFPAALCHILAMLFHELAVFAYFPVIAAIALRRDWSTKKKLWTCIGYAIGTGACIGGAYLVCYSQTDRVTYPSLFAWMTSYAADSGFTRSFAELTGSYLASYIKLFLGGKLSLIRDYLSVPVFLSLAICFGSVICALFLFRRARPVIAENRDTRAVFILGAWFLPSAIFLACWDPGSAFHKLFVWPPVVVLIAVLIASRERLNKHVYAFLALAVAIASWNFGAFIYPHSHATADPVLVLAQAVDRQLPANAIVYYRTLDPDDWYLEYFAPGRTWSPLPAHISSWQERVQNWNAAPVCFETTALQELQGISLHTSRMVPEIDPGRRWDLVNSRHNIRLECLKQTR